MVKKSRRVFIIIIALWLVFLIDYLPFFDLKSWGIIPRDIIGMRGIIFAPLLHGDIFHILNNSFALAGLLFILTYLYPTLYWFVILGATFMSGSLVWLLASRNIHIGASGLVFALAGFLIVKTFKEKKIIFIAISVFLILFYGHLWMGLFPISSGSNNISYASHWYGFLSGITLALLLRKHRSVLS